MDHSQPNTNIASKPGEMEAGSSNADGAQHAPYYTKEVAPVDSDDNSDKKYLKGRPFWLVNIAQVASLKWLIRKKS